MAASSSSLIDRIIERTSQRDNTSFGHYTSAHSYKNLHWPPATAAQLEQTETRLGFPLPNFLWCVYHEIANGGFGPGHGIIGVQDGAPHAGGWYRDIVDGYQQKAMVDYDNDFNSMIRMPSANPMYVALYQISEARKPGVQFEIEPHQWPKYLLPFCYWGCNTEHAIHAMTGEVFVVIDGRCFANWAPSLEVWFERWLDHTLEQE